MSRKEAAEQRRTSDLASENKTLRALLADAERRLAETEGRLAETEGRVIDLQETADAFLSVQIDVQRQVDQALRLSQELFEKAFRASPIPLAIATKEEGRFLDVNESCSQLVGLPRDRMIGRTSRELDLWGDVGDRTRLFASDNGAGVRNFPAKLRSASGELRDVLLSIETLDVRGESCSLIVAFDVSEKRRAEEVRDRLLAELERELADRKKAESALRKTEEDLRQLQKMEAVGSLAGGIAHDFNNILSVILGYTAMLFEGLPPEDTLRNDLEEVRLAAERAADLTRQLLAFSRRQVLEPRVVDLHAVIVGMERMLGRVLGEQIRLHVLPRGEVGKALVDPGQFEQVIMNVAVNARDAMPEGGALTIEVGDAQIEQRASEESSLPAGQYVMVAVTDTGSGMDRETREHMFEPFFTTKEQGKGTGLGLATVFGIVQQSGGHIRVESAPGKGTAIRFYFPTTDRPSDPESLRSRAWAPTSLRGDETILLVEDEAPVRHLVLAVLKKHGYTVLSASNPGEALLLCELHAAKIDLLLTDVVMPIVSGLALAERVLRMRPGTRVLLMSGYPDDAIGHHGVLQEGMAFLPKPIRPDALARKVRQVLDRPASK